jgi:hypothetical protein
MMMVMALHHSLACAGENSMDKADIKKLKESGVFGPLTFWVTEIKNLEEAGSTAAVGVPAVVRSMPCQVTSSIALCQVLLMCCLTFSVMLTWLCTPWLQVRRSVWLMLWGLGHQETDAWLVVLLWRLLLLLLLQSGVLIRGNLRTDRLEVFKALCDKVKELFGSKYEVLMIEDPEADMEGGPLTPGGSSSGSGSSKGGNAAAAAVEPRVAFQVG